MDKESKLYFGKNYTVNLYEYVQFGTEAREKILDSTSGKSLSRNRDRA